MALIELTGFEAIRELTEEVRGSRVALESIAQSLLRLAELPEQPPLPETPYNNVGSYAEALLDMEGEDADVMRQRLRDKGLSDVEIEAQIISFLAEHQESEESA